VLVFPPGLYGGLYGQNLSYKSKKSYDDFPQIATSKKHRYEMKPERPGTSPRVGLHNRTPPDNFLGKLHTKFSILYILVRPSGKPSETRRKSNFSQMTEIWLARGFRRFSGKSYL
jgi:hypothetical protein